MDAAKKTARNQTAKGAPFAPAETHSGLPWSAPDALIHALAGLMTEQLFEYSNIPDHFIAAGFTDADLVLGDYVGSGASFGWMSQVLQWNPKARPGEPGHWTWAPPQPTISDRLRVALHALSIPRESVDDVLFPGAHAAAQRGLNEVLLAHPVLMHPRVRVYVGFGRGIATGTTSVVHAIAMTTNAHFPVPSDWPAGQAPMSELHAFANSTVVRRVLRTGMRSIAHHLELDVVQRRSYFAAAVKLNGARPGLLHSLYSLGRLMNTPEHAPAVGCILEDWKALHRREDSIWKTDALTRSFFAACGVMRNRRSMDQASLYRDSGFLEYVAALDEKERSKLPFEMRLQVFEAIFGESPSSYSCAEMEYNLRAVVSGCVAAGMFDSTESAAARWIHQQMGCVGAPEAEPQAALGYIRTMRDFGIEVQQRDFHVVGSKKAAVFEESAPGWATAMRIDAAERAMREVFERAPVAPAPAPSVGTSRRRRAAL